MPEMPKASNVTRPWVDRTLAPGWEPIEAIEDTIRPGLVPLHRAGLATRAPGGEEIVGSAAAPTGPVADRAYFELLERASVIEYLRRQPASETAAGPARPAYRQARSNGVALHSDLNEARRCALWELVERDRIVRSWYGEITPRRVAAPRWLEAMAPEGAYEWCACSFDAPAWDSWSRGLEVAAVIGFPLRSDVPLTRGFAARPSADAAIEAAADEAVQGLAFLWGEEIPDSEPPPAPTPMYHLDLYLYPRNHDLLRGWLRGAHGVHACSQGERPAPAEVSFVELTPPWLEGQLRVVKAECRAAIPLTFGVGPEALSGHLPPRLRAHPIP